MFITQQPTLYSITISANQNQNVCVRYEIYFKMNISSSIKIKISIICKPIEYVGISLIIFRKERGNCKICWSAVDPRDVDTNGNFIFIT